MTSWTCSSAYLFRQLGNDGALLVQEDNGQYFVLNATGSLVLNAVRNGWDLDRISESMQLAYKIAPERARRDIEALLAEFVALGVVIERDSPSVPGT
jgi:hypothetical protein